MLASRATLSRRAGWQAWVVVEAVALSALLLVGLVMRLGDLEGPRSSFPDLFDEGIRAEQLLLMANGFRPFRDIYAAQGLLLLDMLYPFYVLFGGTLGAIRLGVGLLSLVGIVGAWWTARQVAGAVGGLATVFLLVASPVFLEGSRLALAEVPSLVPCLWAIGCGVRWQRGGGPRWLYAAAALGTVGVLIKPMAVAVALPLGLLAVTRPGMRPRHVAIAVGVALVIVALTVLVMGPAGVFEQIVLYRLGARERGDWELARNVKQVVRDPFRGQPGLFILAVAGALLLTFARWRSGLALAAWPLATIGLLLVYYPLHPKHLVYLYPPLALVGGAGLGRAAWLAWSEGPTGRTMRLATVAIGLALAAAPLAAFSPPPAAADDEEEDADLNVFDRDVARSLQLLSGPREFILTDHPYLAALSRRMVPPGLVDISRGRTRAGALRDRDVLDAAQQYDVRLVLVWADRLRRLSGVPPWLDRQYVLSQAFGNRSVKNPRGAKDRSIYLREDTDLAAAREALESSLAIRETADFEGRLRLLGATISSETVRPGGQVTVTLGWLALAPMQTDYHVTVELVDPRGEERDEQEHDLEGSDRGTSRWAPGRWLFRTLAVQPEKESPAGEYRVQVGVVDPKTGKRLMPTLGPGAIHLKAERSAEVDIGGIQVR